MQFILIAHDKPDGLALRRETRPAHLAYWQEQIGPKLLFGGPLLAATGEPFGSVLVVEAAARAIFEADPYVSAGLFEMTAINGFRHVFTNGEIIG